MSDNFRVNHSVGERIIIPSPTRYIFLGNFTFVVTVLRGNAKLHHLDFDFGLMESITLNLTGSGRQVQYFSSFLLHITWGLEITSSFTLLPPTNKVWSKVMFLQVSVILSTGGGELASQHALLVTWLGGGVCIQGVGVCIQGVGFASRGVHILLECFLVIIFFYLVCLYI